MALGKEGLKVGGAGIVEALKAIGAGVGANLGSEVAVKVVKTIFGLP